jgi:hypothetical protein
MSRRSEKRKRKVADKGASAKTADSETGIKPELEEYHSKLTKLDYILAPLIGVIAAALTFKHVGTAINWDDLMYMDVSVGMRREYYLLNRYGHVYLLKFFFLITGDCITAGKVYWCFVYFGTAVLVYWCAKTLAGRKGYGIGIIAAALFLVQPLIVVREWGCPLADFTAMLYVSLGAFVCLAFLDGRQRYRHLAIMALGLIFFWALKSKITSMCMIVLLLGLGEEKSGVRSIRRWGRDIGWVCVGGLAGCAFQMLLEQAYLGDALFSLRPSSVSRWLDHYVNRPPDTISALAGTREVMSWYAGMAKDPWLVALFGPFMLYLLIGWKPVNRKFNTREKMVWLIPLVLISFLTYARSTFWGLPRYFSPAIPLVCVWAAQYFWFDVSGTVTIGKSRQAIPKALAAAGLIVLAFVIAYVLMSLTPGVAKFYRFTTRYDALRVRFKTDENVLYAVGIVPLVVTTLLVTGTFFKRRGLPMLFIWSLCLILLVWQPLRFDLSDEGMKATAKKSEWRFTPYKEFKDEFQFDKDIKVLVSENLFRYFWMLGKSQNRQRSMFNIFFNRTYPIEHFIHGTWEDILKGDYTYGLLAGYDWAGIREKHKAGSDRLSRDYSMKHRRVRIDPDREIVLVLLKRR